MSSDTGDESAKSYHKVTRKQWSNNNMEDAMKAVAEKEMTVTVAARVFKVPRKTLDDRVKGRVTHGRKPGVATVLSSEEESSLTEYLKYMASYGFPLTRTMVKAFAWAIAKRSGNDGRFNSELGPGDHWWFLYKNRHPELSLRRVDSLQRSRAEALNPRVVKEYFDLLKETLANNNLMNSPRQIYNCDETFIPLDSTREKAVTAKGAKNVYCHELSTSEHITVLCCASAAGIPHPPMIIYKKSFPGGAYRFDGPDDALYARRTSPTQVDSSLTQVDSSLTQVDSSLMQVDSSSESNMSEASGSAATTSSPIFSVSGAAAEPSSVDMSVSTVTAPSVTRFDPSPTDVPRSGGSGSLLKSSGSSSPALPSSFSSTSSVLSLSNPSPSFASPSSLSLVLAPSASCQSPTFSSPSSTSLVLTPSTSHPTPLSSSPSSSTSAQLTPSMLRASPVLNPLADAGLISEDLADILVTPSKDAAVAKQGLKRITGARELTANDYFEMLKEHQNKKNRLEEEKKRKSEEREQKKKEKEKLRQTSKGRGRGRGKGRGKRQGDKGKSKLVEKELPNTDLSSDESVSVDIPVPSALWTTSSAGESSSSALCVDSISSTRPSRQRQIPSRFRDKSDDSDENDGTLCALCNLNEPSSLAASTVFWIDCNDCGCWVHNVCAFGNNTVSRQYVCNTCSKK